MAAFITRILTLLGIVQCVLRAGDREDAATRELLRQREEQERQELTWLLEEVEQRSREQRGLALQGVLLGACQRWWFWASAEALFMLLELYWLSRQSSADGDSGAEEQSEEDEDWEGKAEPSDTLAGDKPLQKAGSSAAPAEQARPKKSFRRGPHPAVGRGSAYQCPQKNIPKRLLLAPLRPPLGHVVRQRQRGLCRRGAAAPPGNVLRRLLCPGSTPTPAGSPLPARPLTRSAGMLLLLGGGQPIPRRNNIDSIIKK